MQSDTYRDIGTKETHGGQKHKKEEHVKYKMCLIQMFWSMDFEKELQENKLLTMRLLSQGPTVGELSQTETN